MAEELNEAGVKAAARALANRVWMAGGAHPLLPEDYDAARAVIAAYLAATTPITGIEGVTNQEVDEFLKENRGAATTPEEPE